MASTRQLAAIMFTDIVRYTALMGKDETKAFELLDINRRIQKPIIEHTMADGLKQYQRYQDLYHRYGFDRYK